MFNEWELASGKYNQMTDPNSKHQDFLSPLSYSFGMFKASPYLSPMMGLGSVCMSDRESQYDLIHFQLQGPEQNQPFEAEPQQNYENQQEGSFSDNESEKLESQQKIEAEIQQNGSPPLLYLFAQQRILIRILIEYSSSPDEDLLRKAEGLASGSPKIMEVYRILLKKIKKLRKTKEEMTKYCMRKAFKSISEKTRTAVSAHRNCSSPIKSPKSPHSVNSIFKKITSEKTMNGNFLKKIFSEQGFLQDYQTFLITFKEVIEQDNQKKIRYLANLVDGYFSSNNIKKIQSIKRLPWTRDILKKTEELGRQLPRYADPDNQPISAKRSPKL